MGVKLFGPLFEFVYPYLKSLFGSYSCDTSATEDITGPSNNVPFLFLEILYSYFAGSLEELSTMMAGEHEDDDNESQNKDDMDLDEKKYTLLSNWWNGFW